MTADLDIQVRRMKVAEVDMVLEWVAEMGVGRCSNVGGFWRTVDASGLLLGLVDGEPAGAVAALRYSKAFGFIGLHLVQRTYRGSGVGQALWRSAMKHLSGCCVGVDAAPGQRSECAQNGFSLAHRNIRYQGVVKEAKSQTQSVTDLKRLGLGRAQEYDTAVFPSSRAKLLRRWTGWRRGTALGIELDGHCLGYGVVGECGPGYHIGPLYAASPELAEVLLSALKRWPPKGKKVFLDVPETNPPAVAIARRLGMKKVGETCRMYASGQPRVPMEEWFGVSDGLG